VRDERIDLMGITVGRSRFPRLEAALAGAAQTRGCGLFPPSRICSTM
jgi:hypothetical protein